MPCGVSISLESRRCIFSCISHDNSKPNDAKPNTKLIPGSCDIYSTRSYFLIKLYTSSIFAHLLILNLHQKIRSSSYNPFPQHQDGILRHLSRQPVVIRPRHPQNLAILLLTSAFCFYRAYYTPSQQEDPLVAHLELRKRRQEELALEQGGVEHRGRPRADFDPLWTRTGNISTAVGGSLSHSLTPHELEFKKPFGKHQNSEGGEEGKGASGRVKGAAGSTKLRGSLHRGVGERAERRMALLEGRKWGEGTLREEDRNWLDNFNSQF
ncbi:hypothetical protein B0O99DRAFT_738146 [Bisporella sp. PMI_857]|nr:hypothetical protein B0O99DRAFT_738146 [Bisporella sp. PMI_857]